ncbi:MAG: DUF11 domain-containing protein [Microbacterium sp.]|nr:DUF11 domain-containing protein [Microbacterium sp.]
MFARKNRRSSAARDTGLSRKRPALAVVAVTSLVVSLMATFVPTAALAAPTATTTTAISNALKGPAVADLIAKLAPGNPGVPSAPITLFTENFENNPVNTPVLLTNYTGVGGQTYTAAAPWLANCNGIIVSHSIPASSLGNCPSLNNSEAVRQIVWALGSHNGTAAPTNNRAVAAYTAGDPGANQIEFATVNPVALPSANGRFLTFSVNAAAKNCPPIASAPLYNFSLVSSGGTVTPVGGQINACSSGTVVTAPAVGSVAASPVSVGTYTSNGSILFNGSSVGIRMTNANGSGSGNDAAFDDIRILDVTPQLDKSFSPATRFVGQTSTLTLTVTNTSELAAKSGWGFVDELPAGLTIAPFPNLGGTCVATRSAPQGGTSITVTNGSLAAGQASCTITVDVTSSTVGSYTNGPDNVTPTGLNEPGNATVEFLEPELPIVTCTSDPNIFNTGYDAATGGILPNNAADANWQVAGGVDGFFHPDGTTPLSATSLPPADALWLDAEVGNQVPQAWTPSPTGNAQWISANYTGTGEANQTSGNGDWYYRFQFDLDPAVNPAAFALTMNWLADNSVAGVWVNGQAQTGANLPQNPSSPYLHGGFVAGAQATTVLDNSWQTGTNVIIVQIKSFWTNEGFNAQVVPTPLCADYGDAPDSYGTTAAQNGPSHALLPGLTIGTAIDAELDGQPTPGADGDDVNGIADEDGVDAPIEIIPGEQTVVTVSVTNETDEVATLAGWIDLNNNGTFDAGERVVVQVPANSGTADYTLTFPVGTPTADSFARFRLFPGVVADPQPLGVATGGEVEDYPVVFADRALEIEKESTQTADSRPGDVVTYTVTATNTGTAGYTALNPAVVFDDLRGVLDDAEYNLDATASVGSNPTYIDPGFISWSGALPAGDSVTLTYSVTLQAGGDGVVRNVAWQPATPPTPGNPPTDVPTCDPATGEGTDPVTGEVCASTENLLPRLTIDKTASTDELPADGDSVTYTVVVTNEGPGEFTAESPATFVDDMTDVLDDATYNGDATASVGTVTYAAPELSWSGPLAAGASATITYTVTYDASTGDNVLINTVCVPEEDALDPDAACDFAQVPAAALSMTKTVDPASGTAVIAGQEVTYTLSFTNEGAAPATVDALDSLANVLDDATLSAGPTADAGLTATLTGTDLAITGEVPVGETLTVTYTVTVADYADQGDHVLGNVLSNGDGTCPPAGCEETENPVRHYTVSKEVAASTPETGNPGDVVTYTLTIVNDGTAAYTSAIPATISDDLSAVLDDATLTGTPTAVVVGQPGITLPVPTFTSPNLNWSGAIGVGQTVTITYSVEVNDPRSGDGELANVVLPTGPGGECAPDECATVTPVQSYTVSKSASATSAVPGDTITYTVVVTNSSDVDYTEDAPASFSDDLSAVLDDAAYNDDATEGATVTGSTLAWEGPLAAGASITITYSVTVNNPVSGDGVLTNAVVPDGPGGECVPDECGTVTPVQAYTVTKEASASTVVPGDTITYTVTVENTGSVDYTDGAPASFSDDLSAVLDDAAYNGDADNGATYTEPTLSWSGALAAGESITVTYSVTVNDPNTGDDVLTNAVVPTSPGGDCVPGECETTTDVQSYTVSKTASATSVQLGGTITYTVTVTNTGGVDYTTAAPASFTDDLSAVLDDASYNDDATNGATVTGNTLAWSGALAAGESIDIVYSVTVNSPNTGDNVLTNAVVPTGDGGSCDPAEVCETVTPVQSYTVTKTADAVDVIPGDTITYTLTITNTGEAAYTAESPAALTDDLSEVLDDATYNGDVTGGATYAAPVLSWSGPLAVGETVTLTYSVTVNDPVTGDSQIDNAVVTENGGNCEPGSTDPACLVNIPSGSFTVSKDASATSALPGDVITYTVTVTNTGAIDYTADEPASFDDNLANVLDDATYNDDASNGATVTGTTLSWSGPLAVGASIEITYSVTVNPAGSGAGDLNLGNIVVPTAPGGDCDPEGECATDTPIGQFQVSKASSGTGEVNEGDVLTYTITVTNNSAVDFTEDAPASFTDDLSAVLDDATYNDDATEGATVDGTTLSWEGPIAAGATTTITYSVTVNAAGDGDGILTNAVVPGDGGTCIGECSTEDALQAYTASKTSSAGGSVTVGDVVTYTVTITNTGAVDYTDEEPASFTDDLSAVLDDATYNDDASEGATVTGNTLSWSGALPSGASLEITYSVTVLAAGTGDGVLTNAVVPTGPGGGCDPEAECSTTDALRSFTVDKSASATTVTRGQTLTYTIIVTNTGAAAFTADAPANVTDDLTGVLDDATYNGDASNGATYAAPILSWSLAIPVEASVTLTYSVTVNDELGPDLELINVVTPGDGGECLDEGSCITNTPVAAYDVSKTVDTTSTAGGEKVTYTITVVNVGIVAFTEENPASFTDDLSEVLDDATYNGDATNGATYTAPVLSWAGALELGQPVSVTYSVTVNDPLTGDRELVNAVLPGDGGACGDACSVTTTVTPPAPPLATTGLNPWIVGGGLGVATLAILAGLALLLVRRRQNIME